MTNIEKAQDEFEKNIRKYSTEELLEFFSLKSIYSYLNNKEAYTIKPISLISQKGIKIR